MMTALNRSYISWPAFMAGMLLVILLYVGLFGYTWLNASDTLQGLESRLDSKSIILTGRYENVQPQEHMTSEESPAPAEHMDANTDHSTQKEDDADDHHSEEKTKSNDVALFPAPIDDLYESTSVGLLPKISGQGITPFQAYKKPFTSPRRPLVALVVMDYGLSSETSTALLDSLPNTATLLLNPYSAAPDHWQKTARQKGFEFWLDLPTGGENILSKDVGPRGLLENSGLQKNTDNLKWLLSRTTGYAGIGADLGSSLYVNEPLSKMLLNEFSKRGIGFLEMSPEAPPFVQDYGMNNNLSYLDGPVLLHDVSLKTLENIARQRGYVIALLHPYPKTLEAVKIWASTLELKGLSLAPLSALTGRSSASSNPSEAHDEPSEEELHTPSAAPSHNEHTTEGHH